MLRFVFWDFRPYWGWRRRRRKCFRGLTSMARERSWLPLWRGLHHTISLLTVLVIWLHCEWFSFSLHIHCSFLVGCSTFLGRIILSWLVTGVGQLWDLHKYFVRAQRKLSLLISWTCVRRRFCSLISWTKTNVFSSHIWCFSILKYWITIFQFLVLAPSHVNLFMQACQSNVTLLLIGGCTV